MSYVPPHLRRQEGGPPPSGGEGGAPAQGARGNYGAGGGEPQQQQQQQQQQPRGGGDARGGFFERDQQQRGGGGGDARRGGGDARGPPQPRQQNSRWAGGDVRGGGGYEPQQNSGSRNFGGGGGGGRDFGGGRGGRKNELGFYGDMRPNERLEKNLFPNKDQTQGGGGINFNNYDKIPVEMSGENCPEPIEGFPEDVFGAALNNNLRMCHYTKPTPVQKYALPVGLSGRDMMACAQTGSGKTGGFIFPVLVALCRDGAAQVGGDDGNRRGRARAQPNALVLAPTRELVSQIFDEAQKFCYCTGVRPVVCYGGAETRGQLQELERGCDMLVATPGRLVDFLERGRVTLAACKFLVLDEADRMLDMGFEPQIRRIVEQEDMPQTGVRQTFMFSATFPREMQMMAGDFLNDYVFLTVGRVGAACKDVTQSFQFVDGRDKPEALMRYLSGVDQAGLTLVFVETKRDADFLEDVLTREGFPASSIHGDKDQRDREMALKDFKSGRTPILVGTDVAARGLDIPNVLHVVNFDLPRQISDYVHRIGRTGRAGNTGYAMSFICDKNRNIVNDLMELLVENGQDVPSWMENMSSYSGGFAGGSKRGGGGYGGKDARQGMKKQSGNAAHGGSRSSAPPARDNSAW